MLLDELENSMSLDHLDETDIFDMNSLPPVQEEIDPKLTLWNTYIEGKGVCARI